MHWRELANGIGCEDPDVLGSEDEEYALYNFLFECREQFSDAIKSSDKGKVAEIVRFVNGCLDEALDSDGEDLGAAAGAAFAEHLFDDVAEDEWVEVHKAVGPEFYLKCRRWIKNWVEDEDFGRIERIHKQLCA